MSAVLNMLNNKYLLIGLLAFGLFGIISFGVYFIYMVVFLVALSYVLPFIFRLLWSVFSIFLVVFVLIGSVLLLVGLFA